MSVILTAKDLYKEYKTASGGVKALNGVSYSFEKGVFYAITGRSGSGKSTLLHALGGLEKPTSGQVFFHDQDLYAMTDSQMAAFRRKHMGFVFQQFNLLDEYNVRNNICMPLKLDHKKTDPVFFREIVNTLGLEEKLKKFPSELSGGQQQRVAIARSLIAQPELIIADEPTGNLDSQTGQETMELLKSCATRFGQTLIVVTHNPEIAQQAQVVVMLEDGRIVES
jgi:putative ABC transport system ATP-binding protein